jgi:hypothetical protein
MIRATLIKERELRGMENPSSAHVANLRAARSRGGKKWVGWIIAAVVGVLVLVMAWWFLMGSSTASVIDKSKYQAVFFTNGQVYFGKLSELNSNYFKLTDVFYIQSQNDSSNSADPQKTNTSNNIQLIKLGSEVHGPDDEMIISRDQVLFFENLKKDGKVTDSISKYNADK